MEDIEGVDDMENQQLSENADSEFRTLTLSDSEQLSNECRIILGSDNCQNLNTMIPLNNMILRQAFIIETSEQSLFGNDTQLVTSDHVDPIEQLDRVQTISNIDTEKSMIQTNEQNIDFTINSVDHFQDLCADFNQINSSEVKTINTDSCLREPSEVLKNADIRIIGENYSNSMAIKILDHVSESPIDTIYQFEIPNEHCIPENVIINDNPAEVTSAVCLKNCKICKQFFTTIFEYKTHMKEHRKFDSVLKKQFKFATKNKKVHKTNNSIKKFKCDYCEWSFNKSNLLRRHIRTHTGEKPFKCSYCSRYFTQQNSLNRHLLKHKGLRPFKCEFCEMNFSQKGHLINHMKRCHAVTKEPTRIHECSMCSCVYNSLNALNKHLNIYHGLKTKISDKSFQKNLPKTVEMDNINETINLIKDPSKLEKWLEEVAHELQSDDNNGGLKHCYDSISVQGEFGLNLTENDSYDHVNKDFIPILNVKSNNQNEVENLVYSSQNGDSCVVSTKKQGKPSINICVGNEEKESAVCAKMVTRPNVTNDLVPSVVQETSNKSSSKKKKYNDNISKVNTNTILRNKPNVATLNLKNRSSGPALKNKNQTNVRNEPKVLYVPNITSNLDDMNINVIQKSQPKVCQFCGKFFKKHADLERHERTHTGDKPFKCDKQNCNKAFATKCSLEYHTVTHLGQMKRAVCPQCNRLFATTSSMKVHMRQHTGEKPFKCPICGDPFRTSGHLHTHVIIHERKKLK